MYAFVSEKSQVVKLRIFYQCEVFLFNFFKDLVYQCAKKGKRLLFLHTITLSLENIYFLNFTLIKSTK